MRDYPIGQVAGTPPDGVGVDGDLATGQNPASSAEAARRVVDRLREEAALPA